LLRINPDGSVPADNPFVGVSGARPEIWAYGLRNPFTIAFQPGTGVLFINDVGQSSFEEIDRGVAGANYGWPNTEGFSPPGVAGVTYPIYTYSHGTGPLQGNAITGGAFYDPASVSFPAQYTGDYFFGDFVTGRIFVRDAATGTVSTFADPTAGGGVVDLDVLPDGRLLYLSITSGAIFQISAGPPVAPTPVDPVNPVSPVKLIAAGTGPGTPAMITALNADGSTRFVVPTFPGFAGGVRVATGDVLGTGIDDIIAVPGPGAPPIVAVYDGATGQLAAAFYALDPSYLGGLSVASADVTGDGRDDIIVGTATGASLVEVFDPVAHALSRAFFAFPGFNGGVNVAAGDLDGDGRAEIIVGTATAASVVTAFSGLTGAPILSFQAFPGFTGGVNVGYANGDILTGPVAGPPAVRTFDSAGNPRLFFLVGPTTFPNGVRVAGDGNIIVVAINSVLLSFDRLTGDGIAARFAFRPQTSGNAFVG
jgi:hypothetical protein